MGKKTRGLLIIDIQIVKTSAVEIDTLIEDEVRLYVTDTDIIQLRFAIHPGIVKVFVRELTKQQLLKEEEEKFGIPTVLAPPRTPEMAALTKKYNAEMATLRRKQNVDNHGLSLRKVIKENRHG